MTPNDTTRAPSQGSLKPCPFCGRELYRTSRAINPYAHCRTEGCFGVSAPVVRLDDPADIARWNRRALDTPAGERQMIPTKEMVDRFLSWKLPESFGPDCYVTFDRERAKKNRMWPVGTNLLTKDEATAMLTHVLDAQQPSGEVIAYRCVDSHRGLKVGNWREMPIKPEALKQIERMGYAIIYAYSKDRA